MTTPDPTCASVCRFHGQAGVSWGIARCEKPTDHDGPHQGRERDWMSQPTGEWRIWHDVAEPRP